MTCETIKDSAFKQRIMQAMMVRQIDTPLGPMIAEASESGLTKLHWSNELIISSNARSDHLDCAERWLSAYFLGKIAPDPVLDFTGLTDFRQHISLTLQKRVQFGEITTYGDLAKSARKSGASRAVGSTMANNPWTLLIPCHRVVKSDGSLGNYSAADGIK
ncbi:MAG: methylated-DNA--[protein]-cysteine S-methyltransferase, partial [Candidatus Poseidoniales archaeon]|nr:methylated-DNA--[protein]-cysteine S-methyltransferase [Candidatus Poseidoniales archaeon]